MSYRPLWKGYDAVVGFVDRRWPWHRWPWPIAIALLIGVRNVLRRENLVDTGFEVVPPVQDRGLAHPFEDRFRRERTPDGSWNDLGDGPGPLEQRALVGRSVTRFGRNVPVASAWRQAEPALLEPSPATVSKELLARRDGRMQETDRLNGLAAAWVQFEVRDWFSHGSGYRDRFWEFGKVRIPKTRRDGTRSPGSSDFPETYINTQTHWWDGSQLYGVDAHQQDDVRADDNARELASELRSGQAMRSERTGDLPLPSPIDEPGMWIGLLMLYRLFELEHNAIAEHLKCHHDDWTDDEVFQTARLVLSAVLAKVHTVEWSTALLGHKATRRSLNGQWYGLVPWLPKSWRRVLDSEEIFGIPGSRQQDFGVPFSITEEFSAVYRMHPLVADRWAIRRAADDVPLGEYTLNELSGKPGLDAFAGLQLYDLVYSFGMAEAGALVLHNFPESLRQFERPDLAGELSDLAATDIMRCREFGVPRFCEFRRALHLRAPVTFGELTDNPDWADAIERVYDGRIEDVDLLVGLFAEPKPKDCAIGDTTFRIFILMAARRLNADRFFTTDFTPEVYSKEGLAWIDRATMKGILLRHMKELGDALQGVDEVFKPWGPQRARHRAG